MNSLLHRASLAFLLCGISTDLVIGKKNNSHILKKNIEDDGSVSVEDTNGKSVQGKKTNKTHVITFKLSQGSLIQIKTNPNDQEITITTLGNSKKNSMTQDDRNFLDSVSSQLQNDDLFDTSDVDSTAFQSHRLASLLSIWPENQDIDFVFDKEKEMDRLQKREKEADEHTIKGNAPAVPGERNLRKRSLIERDDQGRRRLSYTTICDKMNSFVSATHDDWNYDRWDDRTTFYAYVSNHAAGPCSGGTYFWTGSFWSCYEPDHDPSIEYAYGECFGRCGAGCGDNGKGTYTYDCVDHDSCVRFGHDIASSWCNDEFSTTIDDFTFSPNCI